MESNKKVSIVVPCYNQAVFLPETLESVFNQTYQDWECIIVNDGSPDNTEEVAKEWCEKDSRFKYLYKENGGLVDARNKGIAITTGRWILPLDSDDVIGSDYLKKAVEVLFHNPNIGIVYAEAEYMGAKTGKWELREYNMKSLLRTNVIYCSAFFEKSDWEKIGGYDSAMIYGWEDWEFWINLLGNTGKEVHKLDYIGFFYRINLGSMVQGISNDSSKMEYSFNHISRKHADIYIRTFGSFHKLLGEIDYLEKKNKKRLSYKIRNLFK